LENKVLERRLHPIKLQVLPLVEVALDKKWIWVIFLIVSLVEEVWEVAVVVREHILELEQDPWWVMTCDLI
jgi:hypothetical protein